MTKQEINRLIRPYLLKQKRERRKRELCRLGLITLAALYVALLIWMVFLVMF